MKEFKAILAILQRRWKVFGLIFGATVFLGMVFLLVAPKTYEVEVQFLYRESPLQLLSVGGVGLQGMLGGFIGLNTDLETQIAMMSSLDVMIETAKRLPPEDIRYLTKPSPLTYPVRFLKKLLLPPSFDRPPVVKAGFRLREEIGIEPVGATNVIRVVYQDVDRERALRILNAFIQAAHAQAQSVQQKYYARVLERLRPELDVYEDSLEKVLENIAAFQETTLVFSPQDQASALFTQLITLEGLRGEVEGNLAAVRAEMRASRAFRDTLLAEDLDDVLRSIPAARPLWDSLVSLEALRVRLQSQGFADTTLRMQEIDQQIQALQRSLMERLEIAKTAGFWGHPGVVMDSLSSRDLALLLGMARLEARDSVIRREISQLESRLKSMPGKYRNYLDLQRWATYYRQVWTTLKTQVSQFDLLARSVVSPLHVVQHPVPPADPASPKILLVLFASVFLGFVFATGGVFLREMVQQRVFTEFDVETLLGIPSVSRQRGKDMRSIAAEILTFLFHQMDRGYRRFLFIPVDDLPQMNHLLRLIQEKSLKVGRPVGLVEFLPEEPPDNPEHLLKEGFQRGGIRLRVGQEGLVTYESPALRALIEQAQETGILLLIPSPLRDPQGYALLGKVDGVVYGIAEETPVEDVVVVDEQVRVREGKPLGFLLFSKHTA